MEEATNVNTQDFEFVGSLRDSAMLFETLGKELGKQSVSTAKLIGENRSNSRCWHAKRM